MLINQIHFMGRFRKEQLSQSKAKDKMEKIVSELKKQQNYIDIYKKWQEMTNSDDVLKLAEDRIAINGYSLHLKTGDSSVYAKKLKMLEDMGFTSAPKYVKTEPLADQHFIFITKLSNSDTSKPLLVSQDRRVLTEDAVKIFTTQIGELLDKGYYNPDILENPDSIIYLPYEKKIVALGWNNLTKTSFINKKEYMKKLMAKL